MAGIYIHIPFCRRKCAYCDFYSTAQFERYGKAYLRSAVRELELAQDWIAGEPLRTLYFGGGTPSLYTPSDIGLLADAVRSIYGNELLSEVTLEANPEDLSPQYLAGLKNAGIDRLSIGIQSFDDGLLSFMKRRHTALKAEMAVEMARCAGFENIGIDLIYGIPGLTAPMWERTLEKAVALNPEHISAYHLTFEPGTLLGRRLSAGKITETAQEESVTQFTALHQSLVSAGYEHYEVSNFARPGFRSKHNSSYWTGDKYLGVGPGAHSYDGELRRWCSMDTAGYIASEQVLYGSEKLSADDKYNELVMTSLRCADGLPADRIARRAGHTYLEHFTDSSRRLIDRGLLRFDGDRYYLSPRDFLISDSIISQLFI